MRLAEDNQETSSEVLGRNIYAFVAKKGPI